MKAQTRVGLSILCLACGVVRADDPFPVMKEGLWETHSQQSFGSSKSDSTIKMCQNHELQQSFQGMSENLRKTNACTSTVTKLSASTWSSVSHCENGPLKGSDSKTTMSFQGDTAYHMEMHMTHAGADSVTVMDSHYVGSCPADMKPGDEILPNGTKVSMGQH